MENPYKIKVGIDLDDTLCYFTISLLKKLNKEFNKTISLTDFKRYNFQRYFYEDKIKCQEIVEEFLFENYCLDLQPILGAYEILKELKEKLNCEFHIISSRDFRLKDATEKWINIYFPDIFSSIEICNTYGNNEYPKRTKSDICKLLNIKILIDDRIDHLFDCYKNIDNFTVFRFVQPWNYIEIINKQIKEGEPLEYTLSFVQNISFHSIFIWDLLNISWFRKCIRDTILKINIKKRKDINIIIGLSGKIGSGKDTVAFIIQKHFGGTFIFEKGSFAKRLKQTVALITNTTLEMNEEGKNFIPDNMNFSLGQLQQIIGENFRKNIDENIWVNCCLGKREKESNIKIITDVRYGNEVMEIEKRNGLILRINGDPQEIRKKNLTNRNLNHISEIDLDDWSFNHIIENNGTKKELKRKVLNIIYPFLYYHLVQNNQ